MADIIMGKVKKNGRIQLPENIRKELRLTNNIFLIVSLYRDKQEIELEPSEKQGWNTVEIHKEGIIYLPIMLLAEIELYSQSNIEIIKKDNRILIRKVCKKPK